MKTVFIGDIYGRHTWKLIVEKEQPDHVVFMGDYFDSFDIGAVGPVVGVALRVMHGVGEDVFG